MTQQQTTLPNGLRIVTTEMPDSRSVTTSIQVGAGGRYESAKVNGGVSHFLEHLLFKGSKNYPSWEAISLAVDAVGGIHNAYTTEETTNFYIKVPARHRDLPLKILADMVSAPLLDPEEVDRERSVIIEEMNVYRDDPAQFVNNVLTPPLLFPDNALGEDVLGSEKVINAITPAAIRTYQEALYQPHNMVVSVAGRVRHERVVEQVTQLLGELPDHRTLKFIPVGEQLASSLVRGQAKETAQAHFVVAGRSYALGDRREPAARLLAAILGHGSSSRLFINVRERQGLAYTVFADIAAFADSGIFAMYAGVNLGKINQALDAVWEECRRIREGLVGEAELSKAKEQLSAALEMASESTANVAERQGEQLLRQGTIQTVDEQVEEIQAITAKQVRAAARDLLAPEKLRLAIIAPDPQPAARRFKRLVKGDK